MLNRYSCEGRVSTGRKAGKTGEGEEMSLSAWDPGKFLPLCAWFPLMRCEEAEPESFPD